MKLLILISIFSISLFASGGGNTSSENKGIVSTVKKKEIEDSLKNTKGVEDCKSKDTEDEKSICITNLVKEMTPEQLEAIADDLGGSTFSVSNGKRGESVKKFMQERIEKLIYGSKKDKKSGTPQVVDHNSYRAIYKSQLGKNMLLDVNSYCLENIGFKSNPMDILSYNNNSSSFGIGKLTVSEDGTIPNKYNPTISSIDDIVEYTRDKKGKYKRSVKQLAKIKKATIGLYSTEEGREIAKNVTGLCSGKLINLMCERYKCLTSKSSSLSETEKIKCRKEFKVVRVGDSETDNGKIACSLVVRLEAYKKTFKGIQDQEDAIAKTKEGIGFNNVSETITPEYQKIDKITSIGSKELTNEVQAYKDLEKDVLAIDEECLNGDGKDSELCNNLVSSISKEDEDEIDLQSKVATAVYKQRVENASKLTQEEFEQFLVDNGLADKYSGLLKDGVTQDNVAKIISNDYQSKKSALKDTMMDKYNALTKEKKAGKSSSNNIATIADKAEELKDDKEYIETLYEYNNIVTSYLSLSKEEEGNDGESKREVVGSFNQNRKSELESLEKYQDELSDDQKKEYEAYQKMFENEESSGSGNISAVDSVDFVGFLDGVLGIEGEVDTK